MKSILIILLLNGILFGKNLNIHSRSSINNIELLDVYLHTYQEVPLAIIPGGLGCTNFVDISNPSELNVLSEYFASRCDWGRIYSWSAKNHVSFWSGRQCGIHVVKIDDISNPERVNTIMETTENEDAIRYEHTSVYGNLLIASRHQSGVEIFTLDDPTNPQQISVIWTDNAWASLAENEILYVAEIAFTIQTLLNEMSTVSVEEELTLNYFEILPPFPNPFNFQMAWNLNLKRETFVETNIIDLSGKIVSTISEETLPAGSHRFTWSADDLSSGVYFLDVATPFYRKTHKMVLLK